MQENLGDVKFYLTNKWNQPAQAILTLGLVISSFFLPPKDAIGLGSEKEYLYFSRVFIVVITWFILRTFANKWSEGEHSFGWLKVCLFTFILSIFLFWGYSALTYSWTYKSETYGLVLVGGGNYTEKAINNAIALEKLHNKRDIGREEAVTLLNNKKTEDLLSRFAGDINSIWSWWSLFYRRSILALLYLLGLPLFCIALISAIQASYCKNLPIGNRSRNKHSNKNKKKPKKESEQTSLS